MAGTGASGGQNAKTNQAHVLAGTFRTDRHAGHDSPEAPTGQPDPPRPLEGSALVEWERICADLEAEKRLTTSDAGALYQYCQLFAEAEALVEEKAEAKAAVDRLEESFGDIEKSDRMAFFIEVGKMRKQAASYDGKLTSKRSAIRSYLVDLGLTPAARGRVKLPARSTQQSSVQAFRAAKA